MILDNGMNKPNRRRSRTHGDDQVLSQANPDLHSPIECKNEKVTRRQKFKEKKGKEKPKSRENKRSRGRKKSKGPDVTNNQYSTQNVLSNGLLFSEYDKPPPSEGYPKPKSPDAFMERNKKWLEDKQI